jgi:hypothetical protein
LTIANSGRTFHFRGSCEFCHDHFRLLR